LQQLFTRRFFQPPRISPETLKSIKEEISGLCSFVSNNRLLPKASELFSKQQSVIICCVKEDNVFDSPFDGTQILEMGLHTAMY